MRPQPQTARMGRRGFLLLGTAAFAASALPSFARTMLQDGPAAKFLDVSRLLINHDLSPAVGGRIAAFAADEYPDMEAMLDRIATIAAGRETVEEFFDEIPEGPLRDFAHWVIFAWYTGSSSGEAKATLFTYEEALLYQPTLDMVPIPTFGFSAPNAWGNDLYPLTDLPRF